MANPFVHLERNAPDPKRQRSATRGYGLGFIREPTVRFSGCGNPSPNEIVNAAHKIVSLRVGGFVLLPWPGGGVIHTNVSKC
jgi:hypothetical protein